MNKPIIKELIQEDMNEKNLEYELRKLLFDENEKSNIKQHFSKLREVLGGKGASQRIAIKMMNFLNVKNNK